MRYEHSGVESDTILSMHLPHKKHLALILKIIIVLLLVVLLCLLTSLVRQYRQIQHLDYIQTARSQHSLNAIHGNGPVNVKDTSQIQTWMTFDYVNHVFNISPDYLKKHLFITDTKYPRITISQYAKNVGIDKTIALQQVQQFVKLYVSGVVSRTNAVVTSTSLIEATTSTSSSIATSTNH
jgi:hypothetical protein